MESQASMFGSAVDASLFVTDPEMFGCCASYRACSDAKKCLCDDSFSVHCAYRINLEAGRIFYGKNSGAFSATQYEELLRRVEALTPEQRGTLNSIIAYFCVFKRGSVEMIARRENVSGLELLWLFEVRPMEKDFPKLCGFRELKKRVREHKTYGPFYDEARNERKKLWSTDKALSGPNSKEFLEEWLNGEAVSFRDELASPYRMVLVRPDARCYVEELYHDFLIPSYETFIFPENPLNEDGLRVLSDREDDEELRVKLSPGYSREEKERRLATIKAARDARRKKRQSQEAMT